MEPRPDPEAQDNPDWRDTLLGVHPELVRLRRWFRHLPSDPRCKMCLSPQGGIGGPIVNLFGFGRYPRNPQLCNSCFRSAQKHPGGATIEITALFADIRGSTGLAERVGASAYSAAVADYVRVASEAGTKRPERSAGASGRRSAKNSASAVPIAHRNSVGTKPRYGSTS